LGIGLGILILYSAISSNRDNSIFKPSGDAKPTKQFEQSQYESQEDSLKMEFGKNKYFIKDYQLPALIALSFYPELKNIEIQFVYSNTKTTIETRPKISTVLQKNKRCYFVFIDNNVKGNEGILLDSVPFNAQIGILGHEFAHILDYETKSTGSILSLGIDYLNDDGKKKLEIKTDKLTISRGLGWQLYCWADFVLNKSKATDNYKDYKRKFYMKPEEIMERINQNPIYSN
jgi:hypothetical protein